MLQQCAIRMKKHMALVLFLTFDGPYWHVNMCDRIYIYILVILLAIVAPNIAFCLAFVFFLSNSFGLLLSYCRYVVLHFITRF